MTEPLRPTRRGFLGGLLALGVATAASPATVIKPPAPLLPPTPPPIELPPGQGLFVRLPFLAGPPGSYQPFAAFRGGLGGVEFVRMHTPKLPYRYMKVRGIEVSTAVREPGGSFSLSEFALDDGRRLAEPTPISMLMVPQGPAPMLVSGGQAHIEVRADDLPDAAVVQACLVVERVSHVAVPA